MSSRFTITLDQIMARASSDSIKRGQAYMRQGRLLRLSQTGNRISAQCYGSYDAIYRLSATFNDNDIAETHCTCPYDWEGDCKHVVAMLLTYVNHPEQFVQYAPLSEVLGQHTREELIEIIEKLLEQAPELRRIADRPSISALQHGAQLDFDAIRTELEQAFSYRMTSWDEEFAYKDTDKYEEDFPLPASVINNYLGLVEPLMQASQLTTVVKLCLQLLDVCNQALDDELDFSESLSDAVNRLLETLSACRPYLDMDAPTMRQPLLNSLMNAIVVDLSIGGVGYADDAWRLFFEVARPDELPSYHTHVEKQLQSAHRAGQREFATGLNELLLYIEQITHADPQPAIDRMTRYRLYYPLARRLLELNRITDALAVLDAHLSTPTDYVTVSDLLAAFPQTRPVALQRAEQQLRTEFHPHLAEWLIQQLETDGNLETAAVWRLHQLSNRPTLDAYRRLKLTGARLSHWPSLRDQAFQSLFEQGHYVALTDIYLEDAEWQRAWDTLELALRNPASPKWDVRHLEFAVAQKTREVFPDRAIPIYLVRVREQIELRNRGAYATAAELLNVVHSLYDDLGQYETFKTLISDLRHEFKTLRAFQDELNKAGL